MVYSDLLSLEFKEYCDGSTAFLSAKIWKHDSSNGERAKQLINFILILH